MNNLLQLAMEMILCLLIAAIIGAIIGYLIGKMSKCDNDKKQELPAKLSSYESPEAVRKTGTKTTSKALSAAAVTTTELSKSEKEDLSKVSRALDTGSAGTAQAMPKNMEEIEGERPEYLPGPRNGIPDDLKEISGIGLKIEDKLNELGIYHFDQIANWTPENVKWIESYLVFKGRIYRENWIGQAKLLAAASGRHTNNRS